MAVFDIESFRDYWLDLFQNNLGAELSAIETEKGDGVSLPDPSADQYIQNFNDRVLTYESFMYYKVSSVETPESGGAGYSQKITLSFAYVFTDAAQGDGVAENKIFRYTRAMAGLVRKNAVKNSQIGEAKVNTFAPIDLQANEDGWMKAGIIEIEGTIAL